MICDLSSLLFACIFLNFPEEESIFKCVGTWETCTPIASWSLLYLFSCFYVILLRFLEKNLYGFYHLRTNICALKVPFQINFVKCFQLGMWHGLSWRSKCSTLFYMTCCYSQAPVSYASSQSLLGIFIQHHNCQWVQHWLGNVFICDFWNYFL